MSVASSEHPRRTRAAIAVAVAAVALLMPAGALAARPFSSHLYAPTHTPKPGPEHIKVTASKNGHPLSGTVFYAFYFNGQRVSTQPGKCDAAKRHCGQFSHGVFTDTLLWPKRAIGHRLMLDVVVHTKYGYDNNWYWIQVK